MASGGFGMVDEHLRGKRILVVDDERELADMVAAILHGAGFACVDVVHAGAEALAAIDSRAASPERAYQLLVLDVMMECQHLFRQFLDAQTCFPELNGGHVPERRVKSNGVVPMHVVVEL